MGQIWQPARVLPLELQFGPHDEHLEQCRGEELGSGGLNEQQAWDLVWDCGAVVRNHHAQD